ncbi:GGDEF domain-containing protein [Massilia sp. DJPM01]|uniref:GGDEF domain-containing protein n=1 Tax=Massilia sp. DJPM01 TaxID=3024404 RepID=UPI00259FD6BD|nr:GGDEF domain-containing protein [Massilia sp. DJPM01]MDM5181335.1 GGDEF domain-containing protein [Massilia sp. DJPM01]
MAIAHAGSGVSDAVTVSLGVAVWGAAGEKDPATLFAHADTQRYRAKAERRSRAKAAAPQSAHPGHLTARPDHVTSAWT